MAGGRGPPRAGETPSTTEHSRTTGMADCTARHGAGATATPPTATPRRSTSTMRRGRAGAVLAAVLLLFVVASTVPRPACGQEEGEGSTAQCAVERRLSVAPGTQRTFAVGDLAVRSIALEDNYVCGGLGSGRLTVLEWAPGMGGKVEVAVTGIGFTPVVYLFESTPAEPCVAPRGLRSCAVGELTGAQRTAQLVLAVRAEQRFFVVVQAAAARPLGLWLLTLVTVPPSPPSTTNSATTATTTPMSTTTAPVGDTTTEDLVLSTTFDFGDTTSTPDFASTTEQLLPTSGPEGSEDTGDTNPRKSDPRYNVLYIVADDLRPNLGVYDGRTFSPNLDALAKDGIVFDQAYAQIAKCVPSRNSFLTGMRPETLRAWTGFRTIRELMPNVTTFPQWFRNNGYQVYGSGKIFHPNHPRRWDEGFSWTEDRKYFPKTPGTYVKETERSLQYAKGREVTVNSEWRDEDFLDHQITETAIKRISQTVRRRKSDGTPWFVAVGYHLPHSPWNFPERFWHLYSELGVDMPQNPFPPKDGVEAALHAALPIANTIDGRAFVHGRDFDPSNPLPGDAITEFRRGYYASVSFIDEQIGRLLDHVKDKNAYKNTVIVFHSDHGYSLGENSNWKKSTNFESGTRVPLIMYHPDMKKSIRGTRQSGLVELIDLFPTVSKLAGVAEHPANEGRSFSDIFFDEEERVKTGSAFSLFPRCITRLQRPWLENTCPSSVSPTLWTRTYERVLMGYSMRTSTLRYTLWLPFLSHSLRGDWLAAGVEEEELYDHSAPSEFGTIFDDETVNVAAAAEYQDVKEVLRIRLMIHFDVTHPVSIFEVLAEANTPSQTRRKARMFLAATEELHPNAVFRDSSGLDFAACLCRCMADPACLGVSYILDKPQNQCVGVSDLKLSKTKAVAFSMVKSTTATQLSTLAASSLASCTAQCFDENPFLTPFRVPACGGSCACVCVQGDCIAP